MRALLMLLAALLLALAPAARAQAPDNVSYTTRAGDNLYSLAQRYFLRVQDYVLVQRLNRVANPFRMPTNRVLRIPRRLLRHEPVAARIVAFRGDIALARNGQLRQARAELMILEGDMIATGANSFVTLRLADGSTVSLPSRSRVRVQRLRRILLTGLVERLFALETGRARAVVTPMGDTPGEFQISTPVAVSAVRGTEFRTRYDEGQRSGSTEVVDGEVGVSGDDGAAISLEAGFGAVSTQRGTSPAVALLVAPALERPGRVQDDAELTFEAAPLSGAERYHLQIAQDAGFVDVVSEAFSQTPSFSLPGLPDGTWFVRVSAIDASGLEGLAATYSFRRQRLSILASSETRRAGRYREYLFRWTVEGVGTHRFRFQLMRGAPETIPVIDEPGLVADRFAVTDLEPGTYYWRVMTVQNVDGIIHPKWSPMQQLTISADE